MFHSHLKLSKDGPTRIDSVYDFLNKKKSPSLVSLVFHAVIFWVGKAIGLSCPASLPFQYNVLLEIIIIIIKCGQIVLFYWQLMVGSPFFPWQALRSRTLLMHWSIYHTIHKQYSIIALWYYHQFSLISMRWCFRGEAPYPPKWSAINPWQGQLWSTLGLM